MKILGRNPAWWLALVAVGVEAAVAYGITLTEAQQAAVNGAATAVMGLILAVVVARDQIIPAAAGLVVGLGQLFLSFGVHMDQHQIAVTGALVTTILVGFLHTQVTAPIAVDGTKVPRVTVGTH